MFNHIQKVTDVEYNFAYDSIIFSRYDRHKGHFVKYFTAFHSMAQGYLPYSAY